MRTSVERTHLRERISHPTGGGRPLSENHGQPCFSQSFRRSRHTRSRWPASPPAASSYPKWVPQHGQISSELEPFSHGGSVSCGYPQTGQRCIRRAKHERPHLGRSGRCQTPVHVSLMCRRLRIRARRDGGAPGTPGPLPRADLRAPAAGVRRPEGRRRRPRERTSSSASSPCSSKSPRSEWDKPRAR